MLITSLIRYLLWKRSGKQTIKYKGFNCGCCGRYWNIPFEIPTYKSSGKWWDTWGLCLEGQGCVKNLKPIKKVSKIQKIRIHLKWLWIRNTRWRKHDTKLPITTTTCLYGKGKQDMVTCKMIYIHWPRY